MDIRPWRVQASRELLHDRWIHLTADACVSGEGVVVEPFYVLHPHDWVSVLALTDDGHVVLVEEYHHGARLVAPGLVGGMIDPGEDAVTAGARELTEETGYVAREVAEIAVDWANWANHTNRLHYVVARGCTLPDGAGPAAGEETRALRVPVADLIAHPPAQAYFVAHLWHARELLGEMGPGSAQLQP